MNTKDINDKVPSENTRTIDRLKPSHRVFVSEYIHNGGNGTQAYMRAYPNAKYNSAMTESWRMLRKPEINEAIQEEFARIFKEKDKEFAKGETYKLINEICYANIFDIIEFDGDVLRIKDSDCLSPSIQRCIKSIKVTRKTTEQGEQVTREVVMKDSLKALELRAKIQRLIDDEPKSHEVIIIPAVRPAIPRPRKDLMILNFEDEETIDS